MIKTRAYKVKDFNLGQDAPTEAANKPFDLHMIGGLVEDFNEVVGAIKSFPLKSAFSLIGFLAVVFVAFKAGTKFGIIKSRTTKRKGK